MTASVAGLSFSQLDVAHEFACAVSVGGRVWCSKFGSGFEPESPPGRAFRAVTVGGLHVCGLSAGGGAVCWGDDTYGQSSPPPGRFSEIHAGRVFTCGLREGGEVECWGLAGAQPCFGFWGEFPELDFEVDDRCPGWARDPPPDASFAAFGVLDEFAHFEESHWDSARVCGATVAGDLLCWNAGVGLPQRPPAGRFAAVDAGAHHTCALDEAGEAVCWGRLPPALLAPGGAPENALEVPDAAGGAAGWEVPAGPFSQVSSGWRHACGLRPSGEAVCWGEGPHGETEPPGGEFAAVSAGRRLSCGLRHDGRAECWGRNSWWAAAPPPERFAALALSDTEGDYACGLTAAGGAVCWGRDAAAAGPLAGPLESLSLAWRLCGLRAGGALDCAARERWSFYDGDPPREAAGGRFASVSGADGHACGLTAAGGAACWHRIWEEWPDPPAGPFAAISAGVGHACGIRLDDATLECWDPYDPPGWGRPAADGRPQRLPAKHPSAVGTMELPETRGAPAELEWIPDGAPDGPFKTIDAGDRTTCGLRADGAIQCWGATALTRDGPYTSLAVGANVICWRRADADGSAEPLSSSASYARTCWAGGDYTDSPKAPPPGQGPDQATPGRPAILDVGFADCAAPAEGGIVCGDLPDLYSEPELRGEERRSGPPRSPQPASGIFTHLSVGHGWGWPGYPESHTCCGPPRRRGTPYQHACAIEADGRLACWGTNQHGEADPPPEWLNLAPYQGVAAGFAHTCALDRQRRAVCWGDDTFGQTQAPPGEFAQIAAGRWHTCGLRPDGEAECWGDGRGGHRDVYTAPPQGAPTAPPQGPYTHITAGQWHTCALRPDGKPECWYSY